MENEQQKVIKFGLKDDFSMPFGTGVVGSVHKLNDRELLISTTREICRISRQEIRATMNYCFITTTYIPEANMVVGISVHGAELTAFQLSDYNRPILSHFQTDHTGVFHLAHLPRTRVLITVGSGIKVFNFTYSISEKRVSSDPPKITISLRSEFASDFNTTILNPPSFDDKKGLIFLPTRNGIQAYNMDGEPLNLLTKIPALSNAAFAHNVNTQKTISADSTEGICLWDRIGNLRRRLVAGGSAVLGLRILDNENVLTVNAKAQFYLLNIKTARSFHCYTAPTMPSRIFVIDMTLILCYGSSIQFINIIIPWTLWARNVLQAKLIHRIPKANEAARIMVLTQNSFIKLISPRTGKDMTYTTSPTSVPAVDCYYDRGTHVYKTIEDSGHHDCLYMVLDDGKVYGFDTGTTPCTEILTREMNARGITLCKFQDKWAFALPAAMGEMNICDYEKLKPMRRFIFCKKKFYHQYYHHELGKLIYVFEDELLLFDLKRASVDIRIPMVTPTASALHEDDLFLGFSDGTITTVRVTSTGFDKHHEDAQQKYHSDKVTAFAFSDSFWISVSMDGSVLYWNYSFLIFARVTFPIPLFATEVINGKRDIVVATESELMKIEGKLIFDEKVDAEIKILDNFDRIKDNLSTEYIIQEQIESLEDEKILLANRQKKAKEARMQKIKEYLMKKNGGYSSLFNDGNKNGDGNSSSKVDEEMKKRQAIEEMLKATQQGEEYDALVKNKPKEEEKGEGGEGENNGEEEEDENDDEGDDDNGGGEIGSKGNKKAARKGGNNAGGRSGGGGGGAGGRSGGGRQGNTGGGGNTAGGKGKGSGNKAAGGGSGNPKRRYNKKGEVIDDGNDGDDNGGTGETSEERRQRRENRRAERRKNKGENGGNDSDSSDYYSSDYSDDNNNDNGNGEGGGRGYRDRRRARHMNEDGTYTTNDYSSEDDEYVTNENGEKVLVKKGRHHQKHGHHHRRHHGRGDGYSDDDNDGEDGDGERRHKHRSHHKHHRRHHGRGDGDGGGYSDEDYGEDGDGNGERRHRHRSHHHEHHKRRRRIGENGEEIIDGDDEEGGEGGNRRSRYSDYYSSSSYSDGDIEYEEIEVTQKDENGNDIIVKVRQPKPGQEHKQHRSYHGNGDSSHHRRHRRYEYSSYSDDDDNSYSKYQSGGGAFGSKGGKYVNGQFVPYRGGGGNGNHHNSDNDYDDFDGGGGGTGGNRRGGKKKKGRNRKENMKRLLGMDDEGNTIEMIARAPTPPPIRPNEEVAAARARLFAFRPKTPTAIHKLFFELPKPCYVLDKEEVLNRFKRGTVELEPLLKMMDNKNMLSMTQSLHKKRPRSRSSSSKRPPTVQANAVETKPPLPLAVITNLKIPPPLPTTVQRRHNTVVAKRRVIEHEEEEDFEPLMTVKAPPDISAYLNVLKLNKVSKPLAAMTPLVSPRKKNKVDIKSLIPPAAKRIPPLMLPKQEEPPLSPHKRNTSVDIVQIRKNMRERQKSIVPPAKMDSSVVVKSCPSPKKI